MQVTNHGTLELYKISEVMWVSLLILQVENLTLRLSNCSRSHNQLVVIKITILPTPCEAIIDRCLSQLKLPMIFKVKASRPPVHILLSRIIAF